MKRMLAIWCLAALAVACATPLPKIVDGARTTRTPLTVQPPTAKVYLDGVLIGRAEDFTAAKGGLSLTAGAHLLRFEADEYIPEIIELVAGDRVAPVEVRLLLRPSGPKK